MLMAEFIGLLIGVPLAIACAARAGGAFDRFMTGGAFAMLSMPSPNRGRACPAHGLRPRAGWVVRSSVGSWPPRGIAGAAAERTAHHAHVAALA